MNMKINQNILLLAALGIGAYWFVSKKAVASTSAKNSPAAANRTALMSPAAAQLQGKQSQNIAEAGLVNMAGQAFSKWLNGSSAAASNDPFDYAKTHNYYSDADVSARDAQVLAEMSGGADYSASNPPYNYTSSFDPNGNI